MKLDLKFVPFFPRAQEAGFSSSSASLSSNSPPRLVFFSPKLSRYLANPSHCQDLNAAFSVCHIFGILHSASFP